MEVPGALALLELVGYRAVELKGHPYLAIDDALGVNSGMLEKAIKLLLQYQERQVAEENSQQSYTACCYPSAAHLTSANYTRC